MAPITPSPKANTPQSRTVTKRELNQNTAGVLDMVAEGVDVIVTERGKPRWRIVFDQNPSLNYLERLEMQGLLTPANPNPPPWPDVSQYPPRNEEEVMALLDEIRSDR